MKKIKLLLGTMALSLIFLATSCGSMSNEDAYNVGYGVGTILRHTIDS